MIHAPLSPNLRATIQPIVGSVFLPPGFGGALMSFSCLMWESGTVCDKFDYREGHSCRTFCSLMCACSLLEVLKLSETEQWRLRTSDEKLEFA